MITKLKKLEEKIAHKMFTAFGSFYRNVNYIDFYLTKKLSYKNFKF
jgi:hypothetical protein